ncbi:MAG: phosphatase PAP2 family protein [Acinetobacter sp.]|jgi:membrane-associated phospholipid phosphatase|uniref:phosphatase PAP2 family protein n=1 Tax=Acinetobacter sp. TaxID=472 RepID=UPI000FC1BD46|nr:phosphatase PAP2 family protein [Acinetobacter sp.]MBP9787182.1 phosphatase PAP2 family protein [Acinetobacter sp.]RUP40825.1 MAG: phosphatase PAP2 family protein [Acinetobacter sp.]
MPYLLLCIGCFFLGFGVIGFILSNTSNLDLLSVQALFEHRSLMLNHVTILLSLIGGMPFLLFLTTFLCMYQTWIKNYKNVIFITLSISGSIVIGWLLKWSLDRPRPLEFYHLVQSYGASFPSAHSLYAATLASLMMLLLQQHKYRTSVILVSTLWFIFMGISRVYAGVHFPTDVFAGWGIGLIWTSLLWFWLYQSSFSNNLFLDKKSKLRWNNDVG